MNNLVETNAAKLRTLHEAIKKTWENRHTDEKSASAWKQACLTFHASFNALAFPGGLDRAMSLLPKNDPSIIEEAIRFLEVDPFFFRSGYIKSDLIKHLRHVSLNNDQKKRLQKVILARVYEKTRREFRWYCRLAKYVADVEVERQLVELTTEAGSALISRQAQWVLDQLK